MKKIFFSLFVGMCVSSHAQFFQRYFNLDFSTPQYRQEVFNSGLRTNVNFASAKLSNYFFMSVGTSYLNKSLANPDNKAHRMRVARTTKDGLNVSGNYGLELYRTSDQLRASLNSTGNSIAEIDNDEGTGGYIAVGAVGSNKRTRAVVPGGSDASFVVLDNFLNVTRAVSLDFGETGDTAWCIRRSIYSPPTFLVCGHSYIPSSRNTVAFVARLDENGSIIWAFTYGFDGTSESGLSSASRARQLCEDPATGNIYVVGTNQDFVKATNINGLAFALKPDGSVLWSNVYDIAKKDEFQAVRFSKDRSLLIGGSSNYKETTGNNMTNMLLAKLRPTDGFILWKTLLRAGNQVEQFDSKCFDLVEAFPDGDKPDIYLVGPAYPRAGATQLMYRTDGVGVAKSNYLYNAMSIDSLMAIDVDKYSTATSGLAVFSSMKDAATPYSNGHILKTNYNGATCNDYCPKGPPKNIPISMKQIKIGFLQNQVVRKEELGARIFKYSTLLQCRQKEIICNVAARMPLVEQQVVEFDAKTYPNPVKNTLFVNVDAAKINITEVSVHTILGQPLLCKVSKFAGGILQIDVSRLQRGSYVLTIRQNGLVKPIGFIKQ